ncbi:MAG: putative transcriptional regulator [Halonotius sp. J07HN6]|jgi:Predicted transcriptional regulators|nr:MAG: putative transcriptional regulator [Halonotius sp. J07HN6]
MQDSTESGTAVLPESLLDSVSLLSKKWHPAIVRCLATNDDNGFSDLEHRLGDISAKVLTDALDELQEYDIIDRREISQSPLRVNYTLTQRGEELNEVIDSLAEWSETHLAEPETEQVVLVADDHQRIRTMHIDWLADEYTVRQASDGEETLRQLDTDVGVVVLDRRMPGLSGGEVLDWVRSQRYDIRVVMVTSEDVDFDLLDMGFDEYLTKPVRQAELRDVVADLFDRHEYSTQLQQYLALQSKLALLRVEYPDEALSANEEYQRLRTRLEELELTPTELEQVDAEVLERVPIGGAQ